MPMAMAIAVVLGAGARTASAEPYILGFTGSDSVVLSINGGAFLFSTSSSQIDAGIDNQGWWSDTAGNNDANDNYIVGSVDGLGSTHNFFTFDLSNLDVLVTDAELRLPRGTCSANDTSADTDCVGGAPFGSVVYSLWDVTTGYLTLNSNDGTSAGIYSDLGSGILYGTEGVSDDGSPDPLVVTLNAAAITAINRNAGEFFSIGGALPDAVVPEPASLALLLLGGGAAAFRARRHRAS
jgi:hypothetical protein